jgi:hypothetical protein
MFINVKAQEVQFISEDVSIDDNLYNIEPAVEIFKINLTDNYYLYTVIDEGLIVYSYKSKIHEYSVNNGIVNFIVDDFHLELHINSDNCILYNINDSGLKWIGTCNIDFSIMLRK